MPPAKPSSNPSSEPSSNPSDAASTLPSSTPSQPPSTDPSDEHCPILSVDEDSADLALTPCECPSDFPSEVTCQEITFNFDILEGAIGDAIIAYRYRGDNGGVYDLYGGTLVFDDKTKEPSCEEQETAVTVSAVAFNSDDDEFYAVKNGVLNARMLYVFIEANTCALPQNMAYMNLKYDYFDCDEPSSEPCSVCRATCVKSRAVISTKRRCRPPLGFLAPLASEPSLFEPFPVCLPRSVLEFPLASVARTVACFFDCHATGDIFK